MNIYIASGQIDDNKDQIDISPIYWYLKDYYLKFGKYQNTVKWQGHIISEPWNKVQKILEKNPPDLVGFSCYIWSRDYLYSLAKKIKNIYPNCLIVFGGPQTEHEFIDNFWDIHPYIDYIVPGQGEEVFTELIDNSIDNKIETTPEIVFKKSNQVIINPSYPRKKDTVWNNSWVIDFEDELLSIVKQKKQSNILYETTRGCPYGCIYCDWGGGIYTKVKKKNLDIIKKEIEIIAKTGANVVLGNANWGLFPEDLEISKMFVDAKKKYGSPKKVYFDVTKSKNIERIESIFELFIENDMIFSGPRLALQDNDESVLKTIKRQNNHWTDQVRMADRLKKKYNINFNVDLIFGLPGQTVDSWKNTQIDLIINDYYTKASHLEILPNAPIAKSYYQKQFNIEYDFFHTAQSSFFHKPKNKKAEKWLTDHGVLSLSSSQNKNNCMITKCFSFNEYDLSIMNLISNITYTMNSNILYYPNKLIKTLNYNDQEKIYNQFFDDLLNDVKNQNTPLGKFLNKTVIVYNKFLLGKRKNNYIDVDQNWKIKINTTGAARFYSFVYAEHFIGYLKNALLNYFPMHLVDDCLKHQTNCWLDPNYNPNYPRTWESYDYDLLNFDKKKKYILKTTQIKYNYKNYFDINWHNVENKLETYYFQVAFGRNGSAFSKDFIIVE